MLHVLKNLDSTVTMYLARTVTVCICQTNVCLTHAKLLFKFSRNLNSKTIATFETSHEKRDQPSILLHRPCSLAESRSTPPNSLLLVTSQYLHRTYLPPKCSSHLTVDTP